MAQRLLIDRATVFDSAAGRLRPYCRIVIEGERIAAVSDEPITVGDVEQTIDAEDRVVLPGLIDAHVHVVAGDRDRYPVSPPGVGSRWFDEHPADAEEFAVLSGAEGVESAVLVQAVGAYGTDNSYVLDAADAAADRFASVVVLASDDPGLDARLAEWRLDGFTLLLPGPLSINKRLDRVRHFIGSLEGPFDHRNG